MDKPLNYYEQNKEMLRFSVIATFFWGLLAHGYHFFNSNFSHDSLKELHGAILGNKWKVELGRVFVPFYRDLVRSDITIPLLIGVLSLLMLAMTAFLLVKIFNIDSKLLVFLTAGILTTNTTITATAATYLHDLDCYTMSILCAVAAVYFWKRYTWGALAGALLVMASLGMYQSYISVTITLVMFVCILQLLDGEKFNRVFGAGMRAVGMLLAGGGLYYAAMKLIQRLMGIEMAKGGYNTLDNAMTLTPALIIDRIDDTYRDYGRWFFGARSAYPARLVEGITIVLLLLSGWVLIKSVVSKKMKTPEKLLCLVLVGLLPLGMNILCVLIGWNHDLTIYAIWLTYFLILLLVSRIEIVGVKVEQACRAMAFLLMAVLLYGNVQFANGLYLKKALEHDAYLSLMTRVVYRMENHTDYVPGETTVYFSGLADNLNDTIPGFEAYQEVTGADMIDLIHIEKRERFQIFFDYVLGTPIRLVEEEKWNQLRQDPRIEAMPAYPAEGCIATVDDILVVKLGEHWE